MRENRVVARRRRPSMAQVRPLISLMLGAVPRAAHCCHEQCDVRTHVMSEYIEGGSVVAFTADAVCDEMFDCVTICRFDQAGVLW